MYHNTSNSSKKKVNHRNSTVIATFIMSPSRKGPFRLVTVNTAPERAKRLISRMIEALQDHYEIEHVANCSSTRAHPLVLVPADLSLQQLKK
jgi:hypothetical protein